MVSFRTETGLLCLLLADGMGSGESARRESALTCRLLEQFLEAGIEPEAAMKTLNSAMALRGADTGSFTTIDLLTCRPETGELAFYKYGAAPSYLKKGGTVRRITGGSLPAGLRGGTAAPDVTRVSLEPGSFAVMISDGVADPGRDEWLQESAGRLGGRGPPDPGGADPQREHPPGGSPGRLRHPGAVPAPPGWAEKGVTDRYKFSPAETNWKHQTL